MGQAGPGQASEAMGQAGPRFLGPCRVLLHTHQATHNVLQNNQMCLNKNKTVLSAYITGLNLSWTCKSH